MMVHVHTLLGVNESRCNCSYTVYYSLYPESDNNYHLLSVGTDTICIDTCDAIIDSDIEVCDLDGEVKDQWGKFLQ